MLMNDAPNTAPRRRVPLQIAFTADKRGRPIAYYWSRPCMRWMRMGLEAAKVDVATGNAIEVPYVNIRKTFLAREVTP